MTTEAFQKKTKRLRGISLVVGVAGIVSALAVAGLSSTTGDVPVIDKLFQPFIVSYMLWFGLSLGLLAVLMVHHLCGGAWSLVIQRICEAGARTLPLMLLIGAIVLLGSVWFSGVYPWTSEAYRAAHHVVENKAAFLNQGAFTVGFILYFAIWLLLLVLFVRWSERIERSGEPSLVVRMRTLAAPGLILYVLTLTFAATHWTMSLEPEWFSTIYGAWFIASNALTAISFAALLLTYLRELPVFQGLVSPKHFKDLGNFMLGFTIFWSYISFSQFLLIWYGNIPEEIGFYLHRQNGSLTVVTIILMVLVWFVPLFYLLMRHNKTNPLRLRFIAYWILAMRVIDVYWYIAPSFPDNHHDVNFMTALSVLLAVAGVGGVWLWFYLGQLLRRPLLPERDPRRELYLKAGEAHSHG